MREQIRALQKRIGITTVYVTHDQEEAMAISDRIAVMDRGSIVQQGTAQALYYRPATEFVARFIGRTNLLTGRVLSVSDNRAEIEVEGQRVGWLEGRTVAPGDLVRLVVRPEMIDLQPALPGDPRCGIVRSRTFLGERTDYSVTLGDVMLQISASGRSGLPAIEVGHPVTVRFRPEGIHALG
jgi:ABC-type Fe3+/spermidine/putrescine transport system ATPase subunit